MTKIKSLGLANFAAVALMLCCASSCNKARLESGGAYAPVGSNQAPDLTFYQIDASYDLAYSAIDAVFKFESDNRLFVWSLSHDIKHSIDKVRLDAQRVHFRWAQARALYLANPIPANLDTLSEILAELQRLSVFAQGLLPKKPIA